jgi:UDP-GlcNAc:undecaprenyl-phosphate GlcNAc-1-phosphate transferase
MPEYLNTYYFIYYLLVVAFSVLITLLSIPSILHVARTRHLYDDVGHFRKQHDHGIPRLGGVAIFVSFTSHFYYLVLLIKPYLLVTC